MFGRLFRRDRVSDAIAAALYGAIVAQARNPVLYADFGTADTVDGRFEMVVLHTILVLERLHADGEAERAIGQAVFDLYCTDMDRSLRELGVSDLGVPQRMKKMTERFYGRAATYRAAFAARDVVALAKAIERNVFGRAAPGAAALAAYALAAFEAFAAMPSAEFLAGPPRFADPAAFIPAGMSA
ncbi:MAG: ubiquinol-cytochrome C chaperone family protein [Xanthobacteraceae bacterium]